MHGPSPGRVVKLHQEWVQEWVQEGAVRGDELEDVVGLTGDPFAGASGYGDSESSSASCLDFGKALDLEVEDGCTGNIQGVTGAAGARIGDEEEPPFADIQGAVATLAQHALHDGMPPQDAAAVANALSQLQRVLLFRHCTGDADGVRAATLGGAAEVATGPSGSGVCGSSSSADEPATSVAVDSDEDDGPGLYPYRLTITRGSGLRIVSMRAFRLLRAALEKDSTVRVWYGKYGNGVKAAALRCVGARATARSEPKLIQAPSRGGRPQLADVVNAWAKGARAAGFTNPASFEMVVEGPEGPVHMELPPPAQLAAVLPAKPPAKPRTKPPAEPKAPAQVPPAKQPRQAAKQPRQAAVRSARVDVPSGAGSGEEVQAEEGGRRRAT